MAKTVSRRVLRYYEHGDPSVVLKFETEILKYELLKGQVLVQWICSPVNPRDVNLIQGVYAYQKMLPAIGGSEAAGRIVEIHQASEFRPGDLVFPFGELNPECWTDFSVFEEQKLKKVNAKISPEMIANFTGNACTAWAMLKSFVDLDEGDFIIQNSANSGVGRSAIQLAHAWGLRSINIVRDRSDINALRNELCSSGATFVFTEEEFAKEGRNFVKQLGAPVKLALNGVGGRSALAIAGHSLAEAPSSHMVECRNSRINSPHHSSYFKMYAFEELRLAHGEKCKLPRY